MKRLEYSRKTPHGTKRASQTAEFKPGTKSTCPLPAVLCVGSRGTQSACIRSDKYTALIACWHVCLSAPCYVD